MDLKQLSSILVPFDFSELSFVAVRTALSVAAPDKVHLLHVMPVASGLAWAAGLDVADEQFRVANLRARVEREMQGEGLSSDGLHLHLRTGPPAAEVVAFAAEHRPELIIVGSHGRARTIERLLVGSVAQSIVRHAKSSVLVVR
jgi:nucleotide-binding universal stress UspA family protein